MSFISGSDGTNKDDGHITFGTEDAASNGNVNATERMRIQADGSVGIGTDDASWGLSGAGGLIVGDGSSAQAITVFSGSSNNGDISFADATSGTARYSGLIRYNHTDNYLAFRTGTVERLRIDSSGNVTKPDSFHILLQRSGNQTGYNASNTSDPVIWNSVVTTESSTGASSHFDTSTGLFTAPVTGMYHFHGSVNCDYAVEGAWIIVNGSRPNYAAIYPNNAQSADGSITYHITAGETVGWKWYKNNTTNGTINANVHHTWWRIVLLG
tara:strand:- start:69 stop:875 length:807 start_codon:yes stop_codon:yes gene_type:complete